MGNKGIRILIVEDNQDDVLILSRLLKEYPEPVEITAVHTGEEAIQKLNNNLYNLCLMDFNLPGINGIDLLGHIQKHGDNLPTIIITGQEDIKKAISAIKIGAYDYLVKGEVTPNLLNKSIYHAIKNHKNKREKERLQEELEAYTKRLEEMVRERTAEVEYLNTYKELILSTLNDYIRVVDPKEKVIQYESLKIKNAFGNGVGKRCYSFWDKDRECENCISIKAIEDGIVVEKEEDSGERRYFVTAIPLKNRDGSMSAIEVITDITEKKNLEEEVERSRRLAALGEISAHVAHEIRNPLYIIKMGADLLAEQCSLEHKGEDVLKVMKRGVASLEGLVNDILDFSRPYKPTWAKADIKQLVEESVEEMASTVGSSAIELKKELPKEDISLWIDVMRFKSILKNLISNSIQAIKTEGKIRISVTTKNSGDVIHIEVSDNGQGIPESDLNRVFDPFFTTKTKGTGLGMCIVKKITDMHGGNIDIQSEVGKGTAVTINLPIHRECPQSR